MKKKLILFLVCFIGLFNLSFAGKISDKVEKLIETNQTRYEKTYYPRDIRPNFINLTIGFPYMTGVSYSYNINEMFAVGAGAGTYYPGAAFGLNFTFYPFGTTVSPFGGAGITYIIPGLVAANADLGIDIALENGLVFNLAGVYIISFTNIDNSIGTFWGVSKKKLNDLGIKGGIGFRF